MLANFLTVAGQVLTLFLMIGVGFCLTKQGWMDKETVDHASHLLIYIVGPSLIIKNLQVEASFSVLRNMASVALAQALYYVIFLLVILLFFRREPEDTRVVYQFGSVYCNSCFMGLPLLAGILGEKSVIYGVIAVVIFELFRWTHGQIVMGGKVSVRALVVNPGMISIAVGMFLFGTGLRLPETVNNAVGFLAGMNAPLAMIIIGAQMARADILSAIKQVKLFAAAAFKLIFAPLVMCFILLHLRLDPVAYCACVTLCACPSAGVTGVLAQLYHRDTTTGARMVSLTTLTSILTLPIIVVLSQQLHALMS